MKHSKRPKELAVLYGFDKLATQPNLLTGGVALRIYSLILGLFLELLGVVENLVTYNHQLSQFL